MNISRMIHFILLKLSQNHKIFFLEKRNYRDKLVFKSYSLKIDNEELLDFTSKKDLLIYLSERK